MIWTLDRYVALLFLEHSSQLTQFAPFNGGLMYRVKHRCGRHSHPRGESTPPNPKQPPSLRRTLSLHECSNKFPGCRAKASQSYISVSRVSQGGKRTRANANCLLVVVAVGADAAAFVMSLALAPACYQCLVCVEERFACAERQTSILPILGLSRIRSGFDSILRLRAGAYTRRCDASIFICIFATVCNSFTHVQNIRSLSVY